MHLEPTTARLAGNAVHVATVLPRDLTDEAETEAIPAISLAGAACSVERREDGLTLALRDACATVLDLDRDLRCRRCQCDEDRRPPAVALRVFKEIADHPPEEDRVAGHLYSFSSELRGRPRTLFGNERCQVHGRRRMLTL